MSLNEHDYAESLIETVPDFPEPGILFRDLTPIFADAKAFRYVVSALVEPFAGTYDYVAGIEARGFLLSAYASCLHDVGTLVIRKAGKLPREVLTAAYSLEYGDAQLELHPGDVPPGARVLILDDVLATGGTLRASCSLIEEAGGAVAGLAVALELAELTGRERLTGYHVHTIFK